MHLAEARGLRPSAGIVKGMLRMRLVTFALAVVAVPTLVACGDSNLAPARAGARPSPALAVAHDDATLLVHVDVGALRRSPFGPAASGQLLAEMAKLAELPFVGFCGQIATIDAFDDLVISWKGASVRVGATFAKGLSEDTKDACARALASSADRRDELMVSPPGLALTPTAAGAYADMRFEGGRIAKARGKLEELTIDATLDTESTGTTAQLKLGTKTAIRARELATRLDRLLGAPVANAKKVGPIDEAHVVQGEDVVLAVRFTGDARAQETSARALAEGLAKGSTGEKARAELPEVRARIAALADAVEQSAKGNGVFPGSSPWVPGVTPRGTRVPVVSDSANDPSWAKIGVSWRNERTAFRYRFVTADDGKSATIEAHGDLDGDEKESTFRLVLTKKSDGSIARSPVEETDPNE